MSNPPNARPLRWVASRKLQLLGAIDRQQLTIEEACRQYDTTPEELAGWRTRYQSHGPAGLHVTRLQCFLRTTSQGEVSNAAQ
jgi:transposase-like protein